MSRSSFSLFVALLIHFIFIILFWFLGTLNPEPKHIKQKEERIKVSLKEMPKPIVKKKVKDSGAIKKIVKPSKIAPPMPKGEQLKKIVKPFIKYDKKKIKPIKKPNQVKKKIVKSKPIKKIKSIPPKKPYIPLKKKREDESPLSWMYEDKSQKDKEEQKKQKQKGVGLANQDIKKLYGEKFGKLSPGQQKYIIDNQEIMRRITQQVLTRVARVNLSRNLNVNRTNIIEFYLHPNGDMTDFKFLKKSGYYVLDDTTRETIEYSYSRYPRPTEKTLIRYNVFYNLARY